MRRPDWQLDDGSVRLYLGDCTTLLDDIAPTVDVLITDPPYEITATGGGIVADRQYLADMVGFTDCGFDYSILNRFNNWSCFGTLRQVPKLINAAEGKRWMLITWNKPDPAPLCNGNYLPDTEYIVHAWSTGRLYGDCKDKARFIVRPSNRENGLHPNCKPLDVMEKIVKNASDEGQIVLDCFAGSGTTGVACIRNGRRFVGIERDKKHFATAVRRIEEEANRMRLFEPKRTATTKELFT